MRLDHLLSKEQPRVVAPSQFSNVELVGLLMGGISTNTLKGFVLGGDRSFLVMASVVRVLCVGFGPCSKVLELGVVVVVAGFWCAVGS